MEQFFGEVQCFYQVKNLAVVSHPLDRGMRPGQASTTTALQLIIRRRNRLSIAGKKLLAKWVRQVEPHRLHRI